MELCESDARVKGRWRMVMRQPGGKQIGQNGVYLELAPGHSIVKTAAWEDWNPGETLVTTLLNPSGKRLRL